MKTKEIYIHTRCRRKHRLFCEFESCKGNKLVTKIKQYEKGNKKANSFLYGTRKGC
jgi:hypothetical protein